MRSWRRPLGASFADGFSKPTNGGLSLGDGTVSLIALVGFVAPEEPPG